MKEPKASEDGFTPDNNYRVLEVSSDCLMEEFVVNEIGKYELSRVLFEFTNKAEEITEDKKVVIMNKVYYYGESPSILLIVIVVMLTHFMFTMNT